jgi:hypothetical protein
MYSNDPGKTEPRRRGQMPLRLITLVHCVSVCYQTPTGFDSCPGSVYIILSSNESDFVLTHRGSLVPSHCGVPQVRDDLIGSDFVRIGLRRFHGIPPKSVRIGSLSNVFRYLGIKTVDPCFLFLSGWYSLPTTQ